MSRCFCLIFLQIFLSHISALMNSRERKVLSTNACYDRVSRPSSHLQSPPQPQLVSPSESGPRRGAILHPPGSSVPGAAAFPRPSSAQVLSVGVSAGITRSLSEGNCLVEDELLESEETLETGEDTCEEALLDNIFNKAEDTKGRV